MSRDERQQETVFTEVILRDVIGPSVTEAVYLGMRVLVSGPSASINVSFRCTSI